MTDLRQDKNYAKYLNNVGWEVIQDKKNKTWGYVKKLPLVPFYLAKIQRPADFSYSLITEIRNQYRVIVSGVEPVNVGGVNKLIAYGYRLNKTPFLPTKTIVIDLKKDKEKLLLDMKPKTRYNIGLAKRKGIKIQIADGNELKKDVQIFEYLYKVIKENARRLGIHIISEEHFKTQVEVFGNKCFSVLAYKDNTVVAGAFYMTTNDSVFYSHNGSTDKGKKLFAPTLCVFAGMLEAKKRKARWFDFDGVFDERFPLKRWKGFSRFKIGFGGEEKEFPGLWSRWHWPY